MKLLLLTFILIQSLFAITSFTLTNLQSLNIYFINESDLIDKSDVNKMKEILQKKLNQAGIKTDKSETTLAIKVESFSNKENHYIYINFMVGEEVISKRKDHIQTFSLSYRMGDFIESETPKEDIHTSITDFLIGEFLAQYKEENL